jgi:hypothetical protein
LRETGLPAHLHRSPAWHGQHDHVGRARIRAHRYATAHSDAAPADASLGGDSNQRLRTPARPLRCPVQDVGPCKPVQQCRSGRRLGRAPASVALQGGLADECRRLCECRSSSRCPVAGQIGSNCNLEAASDSTAPQCGRRRTSRSRGPRWRTTCRNGLANWTPIAIGSAIWEGRISYMASLART